MKLLSASEKFRDALGNEAPLYGLTLTVGTLDTLSSYYKLLMQWNDRLHLVAPCSAEEFAARHVLESLLLLDHLPSNATIADIGSGAGLPIIPCVIARPDIRATLIEASKKKVVFLKEALIKTATSRSASVVAERFEEIDAPDVEFVSCRALERFEETLPALLEWAPNQSKLLLFGGERLAKPIGESGFEFTKILIPNSRRRFLFLIAKRAERRT